MALPVNGSTHLIPAYYSFVDPEGTKGWVGLVGWPVADGVLTLLVTHQLQVEHRTGKVCQSATDIACTENEKCGYCGKSGLDYSLWMQSWRNAIVYGRKSRTPKLRSWPGSRFTEIPGHWWLRAVQNITQRDSFLNFLQCFNNFAWMKRVSGISLALGKNAR